MFHIILFDIDGTLVLTGGAGVRAMSRAFRDVFAVDEPLDDIPLAGRTDSSIIGDALARAGLSRDDDRIPRVCDRYYRHLAEALEDPHPGKRVMPGIRPLLDALHHRDDVFLGLLTGNLPRAARLKLDHFDLWHYFRCGAFGDDAENRDHLLPVAVARAEAEGAPRVAPERVLVVGDTPLDVACAAASGARSVAVATGSADATTLRACGADVVFDDLSDTDAFLAVLTGSPWTQ